MVVRGALKFLAAFFTAALIFLVILAVAGYFAVRNFDPNMFRAEFEKYLTQQTGFRAELGDIKLRWRPQPKLQVEGLKFFHPVTLEKILEADQVRIDLDLTSVWQKHFNMSQALIQSPEIFLKRNSGGLWNWQFSEGAKAAAPAAPAPAPSQVGFIPTAEASEGTETISLANIRDIAQGWEFEIGKISVRDGTVHFTDESVAPAFHLEITHLDADVRQKSPAGVFHFTAGASVLNAAERNLELEGDVDFEAKSLTLVLRYGPEKIKFQGVLKLIKSLPLFEGDLEVRDLDIEPVVPEVYKSGNYVTGRLSMKSRVSFEGANPESIQRSLVGQGTIEIKEGAFRNRNLVREVFDKLSSVISVTSALGAELPPELNEMLKGRDTPFDSLQLVYAVQSGVFKLSELRLAHPHYQLTGQGKYGLLDKRVEGTMQLLLSKAISGYMIKKIHELAYLSDATEKIMIPFRYSGVIPEVSVQPDLPYIASRVLQGGTDQLLSRGLEKLSKRLGTKKDGQAVAEGTSSESRPTASSEPLSDKEQLIQQGLALFSQYQAADARSASPTPSAGQTSTTATSSEKEQLIQQGLALLTKYRETENQ